MAASSKPERKSPGRPFQPGQSGNPGGQSKTFAEFRKLIRDLSPKAVTVLQELLDHEDGKVRVAAVREVLDRSWGKAAQPVTGEDGGPVKYEISTELVSALERLGRDP